MCMLSIEIGGCVIYRNLITHNPLKEPITEHGPFMGIRYIYRIGYGGYYKVDSKELLMMCFHVSLDTVHRDAKPPCSASIRSRTKHT